MPTGYSLSGGIVRATFLVVVSFQLQLVLHSSLQLVDSLSVVVVRNETSDNMHGPIPEIKLLYSNEHLEPGQYRTSPGNTFRAGLSESGDFVMQDLRMNTDNAPPSWSGQPV